MTPEPITCPYVAPRRCRGGCGTWRHAGGCPAVRARDQAGKATETDATRTETLTARALAGRFVSRLLCLEGPDRIASRFAMMNDRTSSESLRGSVRNRPVVHECASRPGPRG